MTKSTSTASSIGRPARHAFTGYKNAPRFGVAATADKTRRQALTAMAVIMHETSVYYFGAAATSSLGARGIYLVGMVPGGFTARGYGVRGCLHQFEMNIGGTIRECTNREVCQLVRDQK